MFHPGFVYDTYNMNNFPKKITKMEINKDEKFKKEL